MQNFVFAYSEFIPKSATEFFGSLAFFLHLAGYTVYAKKVFSSRIRPNVATWSMWLFGNVVELVTYNAIEGSHWSTSALPFACLLGIGTICFAILYSQMNNLRTGRQLHFHKPERTDYYLAGFDASAGLLWVGGLNAALANGIAVVTSIASFYPIWRTTYHEPGGEDSLPWGIWSLAYIAMIASVITLEHSASIGLYLYPSYYLLMHGVVYVLSKRGRTV